MCWCIREKSLFFSDAPLFNIMGNVIQKLLDNVKDGEIIQLPVGEYMGPFYIRRPCKLIGNKTTLWTEKGSVLNITANGVSLEGMRVETTGDLQALEDISIECGQYSFSAYNVGISGNVGGDNLENVWDFPKSVDLGKFTSGKENTFYIEVFANNKATVTSKIDGIYIEPRNIKKGINKICIKTDKLRNRTCIFGEILIESKFIRRIYVSGQALESVQEKKDECLYSSKSEIKRTEKNIISENIPKIELVDQTYIPDGNSLIMPVVEESCNEEVKAESIISLQKGQRIGLKENDSELRIVVEHQVVGNVSVDPYLFLVDERDKVKTDNDLIFFGNNTTPNQSIEVFELEGNKTETSIKINKVESWINKIIFVFSIYQSSKKKVDFSRVKWTKIRICSDVSTYEIYIDDIKDGQSMIPFEIYKYKGLWKLRVVSSELHSDIEKICETYGVNVD